MNTTIKEELEQLKRDRIRQKIREVAAAGGGVPELAKAIGCHHVTARRHLRDEGAETRTVIYLPSRESARDDQAAAV